MIVLSEGDKRISRRWLRTGAPHSPRTTPGRYVLPRPKFLLNEFRDLQGQLCNRWITSGDSRGQSQNLLRPVSAPVACEPDAAVLTFDEARLSSLLPDSHDFAASRGLAADAHVRFGVGRRDARETTRVQEDGSTAPLRRVCRTAPPVDRAPYGRRARPRV